MNYLEVETIDTVTTPGNTTTAGAFTDGFTVGGTFLPLNQFHFHSPSEHTVNGAHYPLEMHMVHKLFTASAVNTTVVSGTTPGAYNVQAAVIGIMFTYECVPLQLTRRSPLAKSMRGTDRRFLCMLPSPAFNNGTFMTKLINALATLPTPTNLTATSEAEATVLETNQQFDLIKDVFNVIDPSKYYTYAGSLTTPACTEGITWFNMANPMYMSPLQLLEFTRLLALKQGDMGRGGDNRLIQPLNGRKVSASF